MNDLLKRIPIIYPILLGLMMIVSLLSIFSNSTLLSINILQKANMSLMTPNEIYLYLGGLSIIWLVMTLLYLEFCLKDQTFKQLFDQQLRELLSMGCLFTLFWMVSWQLSSLLLPLIFIALATNYLLKGIRIISQNKRLREKSWLTKLPIGFFAGWLMFETIVTLFAYMHSVGISFTGVLWEIIAIVTLLSMAIFSSYYYAKYGNSTVMITIILGMIALAMHHQSAQFLYANKLIYYVILGIGLVMVALFVHLTQLKIKQKRIKA